VVKLTSVISRHQKFTSEWFVLDTKLTAAKEELVVIREDCNLDFLDTNEPVREKVGGIPKTVLVRSEEKETCETENPREEEELDLSRFVRTECDATRVSKGQVG
jgi:hypothetical protein